MEQTLALDYALGLLEIALEPTLDPALRQLATLTLKSFVDTHWSSKGEKFVGPQEPPVEIKTLIKSKILKGLSDSSNKLRVACAYLIAKIAHHDWPETWETLFDELMALLKSGNSNSVHGAIRVLTEFIRDDISDQQFPYIAPVLLPELYSIFTNEQTYPSAIRARCLGIFRDFAEILFMIKEEHPEAVENYLFPILPSWMEAFKRTLSNGSPNPTSEEIPLRNEVLRTLVKLARAFPRELSAYLVPFLEPIWAQLLGFSDQYVAEYVMMDNDNDGHVDSDGEVVGIESILFSMFEYIGLAARKKGLRSFMTSGQGAAGEFLAQLVLILLKYMQITSDMESTWSADVNQFIQDDEEEALNYNVRIAVEELLQVSINLGFI